MNESIDIVKPRIHRPLFYFISLLTYLLVVAISKTIDNFVLSIITAFILFFITTILIDKVLFTKKIGHIILEDATIEIFRQDKSENVKLTDLCEVSIKAGFVGIFGSRELTKCSTLLLTLYSVNGRKNKIYLSNSGSNFLVIDTYIEKLSRLGIKVEL